MINLGIVYVGVIILLLFCLVSTLGLIILFLCRLDTKKAKRYLENITFGIFGGLIAVILSETRGNQWTQLNFYVIELPLTIIVIFVFVICGFLYLYSIDKLFWWLDHIYSRRSSNRERKKK